MEMTESRTPAFDCSESSAHNIPDVADALICEDDEALYPGIECFDIVECDNPDLMVPLYETETFDLPPDILKLTAENLLDANIIYACPEMIPEKRRTHRSKNKAKTAGAKICLPNIIPIITSKEYSYALTFYKGNKDCKANLQLINPAIVERFKFKDGKLYFQGVDASSIDLTPYYDSANDGIFDIDLALLHCLFYMCLYEVEPYSMDRQVLEQKLADPQYIGRSIKFYVRGLLKQMGYKSNNGRKTETDLLERIKHFGKILGLISDNDVGGERQRAYPVVVLEEYNEVYNTVRFASPYMHILAIKILLSQIDTNRPTRSILIKSSIAKRHSRYDIAAFEIVTVVVRLIEQCGNKFPPGLKGSTLLERCPCLNKLLEETGPTNKRNVFDRVFRKAWSCLENQTKLKEKYKNIYFPPIPSYNDDSLGNNLEFRKP